MDPRTIQAQALTDIMLAIFRINGKLLAQGDTVSAPLGLTSARWQVLGAIALSDRPQSVPQIAETMGITRQGAQKQVNLLEADGLALAMPNPRHKRSPLYHLTEAGIGTFANINNRHTMWANRLSDGMATSDLQRTLEVMGSLEARLEIVDPLKASEP
ncbi:MarR family transcriptional regulator [Rhizobium sp. KVB221]|uniref:MarR family transcriptional regulator n=1 Tax=Rhizobium setariae TaxID=2801340 RepID=A0A937CNX1_9HYPH|nr:helix-turn-helix domain-containing protein [Rhizobium setariae]MBL0371723.1 MarR family transcriptional regulator [Rhizobium setariae]